MSDRTWTPEADDRLREAYGKADTREVARELGRSPSGIKQRARKLGLSGRSRAITADEVRLVLELHSTRTAAEIADAMRDRLGSERGESTVHQIAASLGLRKVAFHGGATIKQVQALHGEGRTIRAIAGETGLKYDQIKGLLSRFDLKPHRDADARRRSVATQMRTLGLANPAELRARAYRRLAESRGWPADLKPRAVQILELLAAKGRPMDRWEIGEGIGWNMERARKDPRSLLAYGNAKSGGSYVGLLISLGFVVKLTRARLVEESGRKKRRRDLYVLSPAAIDIIIRRNQSCETA